MTGGDTAYQDILDRVDEAKERPMSDHEAVHLIAWLHGLAVDVLTIAPPPGIEYPLSVIRASKMVEYVADKLDVPLVKESELHGRH